MVHRMRQVVGRHRFSVIVVLSTRYRVVIIIDHYSMGAVACGHGRSCPFKPSGSGNISLGDPRRDFDDR